MNQIGTLPGLSAVPIRAPSRYKAPRRSQASGRSITARPVSIAWRSTEPEENTDPDKYPAPFRLDPDDLATLPVAPSIPPRRQPEPDR